VRVAGAAAAGTVAVLAVAGCLAATGLAADSSASPAAASRPSALPAATARIEAGVPGCSTTTATAPALTGVPTGLESVPGAPFGVVVTADGRWSFVALTGSGSVGVFGIRGARVPSLVRQVSTGVQPVGEALTPGGRYLLAADGENGAVVINVRRAESGQPGAVLGVLGGQPSAAPGEPARIRLPDGAIEVAVSPDGRFAFVSLEDSASIAVYDLHQALTDGFGAADLVGMIPVGQAPVGMAVSPDGRWLYVTSEIAADAADVGRQGSLTVISLARAESDPAASVAVTVDAGCNPVRVITSAGGSVVWVTARGSDRLLGFSAARLRTDPAHALVASVGVGEAPVDLELVDHGSKIVVADSNRFNAAGATSGLCVVDVAAALAGRPALIGYLPAGGFPREMALEPAGRTLLVTNFSSQQLESVGVDSLP
jgi:DNA-binding beta-propeller fold protein YncE